MELKPVAIVIFFTLFCQLAGAQSDPVEATQLKPNVVRWATASESDNFGYDVYRGLAEDGPFERINPETIPGAGTTDIPQRYEYTDDAIQAGIIYWYYVESISYDGSRQRLTPVYPSKAKTLIKGSSPP